MTTPESHAKTRSTPFGGLAFSCAILLGAMTLVLFGVGAWAYVTYGWIGVAAAATAWTLCTFAAVAALLVSVSFAATPLAPTANLGTMAIRMGIPLFGLIALPNLVPTLASAGLLPSLLVCYLAALVVETLLALRHVVPTTGVRNASARASSQPLEAK